MELTESLSPSKDPSRNPGTKQRTLMPVRRDQNFPGCNRNIPVCRTGRLIDQLTAAFVKICSRKQGSLRVTLNAVYLQCGQPLPDRMNCGQCLKEQTGCNVYTHSVENRQDTLYTDRQNQSTNHQQVITIYRTGDIQIPKQSQ